MTEEPRFDGLDHLRLPPPADLEDAVVDALAAEGWIDAPTRRASPPHRSRRAEWWPWAAAAAGVALFLLGALAGGMGGGGPAAPLDGPRFVVFLFEGPDFHSAGTPEEHAAIVREYVGWSDSMRAAGVTLTGEELAERGSALAAGPDGVSVEEGRLAPESAGPEILAGFHIVAAPDLDAAIEIASTHPHLRRGGRIVVRPIVEH